MWSVQQGKRRSAAIGQCLTNGASDGSRALWRAREIEGEILLLGEADKVPLVGEVPVIPCAESVQYRAARFTDAQPLLEQLDGRLRGEGFRRRLQHRIRNNGCQRKGQRRRAN